MSIASEIVALTSDRDAIRQALIQKGISASAHGFDDFATDISQITAGGITPTGSINIVTNGTVDVTNYASAVVAVPTSSGNLQGKSVSYSTNGTRVVTPDSGYSGLSSITIEVAVSSTMLLETKEVTPTGSDIIVNPSQGYGALSSVTVKAVDSTADANFVAANIKNGVTVFGVTGTYAPSLTTLSVTPSGTQQTFTPSSGLDGYSSVIVSAAQLESKEASPSSVDQTVTPSSGKYGLSQVVVKAAPLQTLQGANAITPTTTEQYVTKTDNDCYGLSVVQVRGDANLIPAYIANGVTIFGVTGTHAGTNNRPSVTVTPSLTRQTIDPTGNYTGLAQVIVEETPLDGEMYVTPTTTNREINPTGSNIGIQKITVIGDANLIAANIKNGVTIFDVEGTYTGGSTPANGSLIEITCSSNIDTVTATVNGNTYTGVFVSGTAYVTIPYTDTTVARTCVLKAYYNGTQMTSTQVAMSAGIGYYTASLETSQRLYYYGTWYGVSSQTWTKSVAQSTVTDSSSGLQFYCPYGNYSHTFTLSPNIDTRGYKHFKIRGTVTGGVYGSSTQRTKGDSYIQIGSQFINFPNQNSGTNTFTITSEQYETASDDATLTVFVSVPMEYAPGTVLIYEIEFV